MTHDETNVLTSQWWGHAETSIDFDWTTPLDRITLCLWYHKLPKADYVEYSLPDQTKDFRNLGHIQRWWDDYFRIEMKWSQLSETGKAHRELGQLYIA
jgi:hypothetical protein